jgi:hypothetical protein
VIVRMLLWRWRRRHSRALRIARSWAVESDPGLEYSMDEAFSAMAAALVDRPVA